ncbi:MAG: hypothetical protein U0559_02650 [Anaerolineae bacterium]
MAESPERSLRRAVARICAVWRHPGRGNALAPRLAQRFGTGFIGNCDAKGRWISSAVSSGDALVFGGEYFDVDDGKLRCILPRRCPTLGEPYPDYSRYGEVETFSVDLVDVQ